MNVLILDNKSEELDLLLRYVKHRAWSFELVKPNELAQKELGDIDCAILTGGYWYEDPSTQSKMYENELEFIKTTALPVLGICLGAQLIAIEFGGEVAELKEQHHGERTVQLTQKGKELFETEEDLIVSENHTIGITSLDDSFEVLATSTDCIEAFSHKHRPLVGVQFHPERLNKQQHSQNTWDAIFKALSI